MSTIDNMMIRLRIHADLGDKTAAEELAAINALIQERDQLADSLAIANQTNLTLLQKHADALAKIPAYG